MEIVLDEDVRSREDVEALGVSVGDFVCFEPRSRVTSSGYIKSRFLDDKLSAGALIAYAQYVKDRGKPPMQPTVLYFTAFEEVGHGASSNIAPHIAEIICVDMGCVGEGLTCTERMVSICAKDKSGPYHYDVVNGLIDAAKRSGAAIPAARIVGTVKRARVGEAFAPNENEALAAMFGSPASEIKHERFVAETVPRSELWEAQTPQVFRRDLYERAVQERGDFIPTDDASLLERLNLPVAIVESDRTNIKITTQADLSLAEKLLAANRSR